ncbi:MAG: class I SAM-dependent methyltransferase [Pseudomonadota bacterium]
MRLPAFLKPVALAVLRHLPWLERRVLASAGYRRIDRREMERLQGLPSGWKNESSARRQQLAYEALLAEMRYGRPRQDFRVVAEAVDAVGLLNPTLLEVGCGGGYHSAVLEALATCQPVYTGSDFSSAMVESARRRFPGVRFEVADATKLPYTNGAFDIVLEGVSLMHIPDWRQAIAEIARVARSHVVFHSVPLFDEHPTEYLVKQAYGQPVTEAIYNRAEFERTIEDAGLAIERVRPALSYDVYATVGAHSRSWTFLCGKAASTR